jgi:hypothetical protein
MGNTEMTIEWLSFSKHPHHSIALWLLTGILQIVFFAVAGGYQDDIKYVDRSERLGDIAMRVPVRV